jgi:hypothetical protein
MERNIQVETLQCFASAICLWTPTSKIAHCSASVNPDRVREVKQPWSTCKSMAGKTNSLACNHKTTISRADNRLRAHDQSAVPYKGFGPPSRRPKNWVRFGKKLVGCSPPADRSDPEQLYLGVCGKFFKTNV